MTEITLIRRTGNYFVPATVQDEEAAKRIKVGDGMRCKFTKVRNLWFHRKFFALLGVAYEALEAPNLEYKGQKVEKNKDEFREEIIILAGFYIPTFTLRGDVRLKAKSISFGSMNEDEFDDLYSKTIDVILQKVLKNYTRDDLDKVVDEVLGFI